MDAPPVVTLDQYQAEARRTAPRADDAYPESVRRTQDCPFSADADLFRLHDVLIWALGLAGEAGEVCDLLKKTHGHGKPYDADKLKRELGDVLWYLSNLADAHGFTLQDVAQTNVDKLRARFPVGFTVEAAAKKADEGREWNAYTPGVEKVTFAVGFDANGSETDS